MDGYGRLHDIPAQEMSRLADYFIVAGIDRDSKNGKKYSDRSQLCVSLLELLYKHCTPLEIFGVSYETYFRCF